MTRSFVTSQLSEFSQILGSTNIARELANVILSMKYKLSGTVIANPRQSDKTTLVKALSANYYPINPEFPVFRAQGIDDSRLFLASHENAAVIDEVQRVPAPFSCIQGIGDDSGKNGLFILTGFQNFLLLEQISQTLAARSTIFHLLLFSFTEIASGFPIKEISSLFF